MSIVNAKSVREKNWEVMTSIPEASYSGSQPTALIARRHKLNSKPSRKKQLISLASANGGKRRRLLIGLKARGPEGQIAGSRSLTSINLKHYDRLIEQ